jgi:hypothetical protein
MKNQRYYLQKELTQDLIDQARQHVLDGYSLRSFSGKAKINLKRWEDWIRQDPQLMEIRDKYNASVRDKKRFYARCPKAILD